MQRLMSVLLVAVAACGGSADGGSNDLPDAAGGALDSSLGADGAAFQGLTISWVDAPSLPGSLNLSTGITVTRATFHIKKLEAISDGGAVPEATENEIDISWGSTFPTQPYDIQFFSAPPAIYSKIRLSIDKGPTSSPSIEIVGTWNNNGTTENFKISSLQQADLEVAGYATNLGLGDAETMPIIVKLDALLGDVNWMALRTASNVRTLDDTDTVAMTALFDHLELAFTSPLE